MLATIGDLVEDVIVRLGGAVNVASDTSSTIERRQGGSAANVAVAAARMGHPARFIGQVGDDVIGRALTAELRATGVDIDQVRHRGPTGTIVVLVDRDGERSMLTDRGACLDLENPDPEWLDGVSVLHVPFYSLTPSRLADTTRAVVVMAHERQIAVSIDLSSAALIETIGADHAREAVDVLRPSVVFANADEAGALGILAPLGPALTVIKHGPDPVILLDGTDTIEVEVESIGSVPDTTGAGDAFAAGFLTFRRPDLGAGWAADPVGAAAAANRAAAAHLATIGSPR